MVSRSTLSHLFRKFLSFKNLSLFLIPKNGKIFPKFLNKEVMNVLKLNVEKNGLISLTLKLKTLIGPERSWRFYMTLIRNIKLNGI